MNITNLSFSNKQLVYFLLAIMLLGGVWCFDRIGKTEDAPFVIKSTVLVTSYPGATPLQVEQLITEPIEREVQTLKGVYKISSESFYSLSKITVELDPATDKELIPQRWDELRRKVLNIQPMLPVGAGTINVSDDFGDVFGIYYALVSDKGFSYAQMRDMAQRIKTSLVAVQGVQKVALYGEQTEVVNVEISSSMLSGLNLNVEQIIAVISSQNQLVDTGVKRAGELNLRIMTPGVYTSLEDIANQLITTSDGSKIRLGDFANITSGYQDPPTRLFKVNGKRAVGIGISSTEGENVVEVGRRVRRELDILLAQMPLGVSLEPLYLEDEIAQEANVGFLMNLLESVAIVILIIMLVMGLRSGILICSSLLFSIGGTMLIMYFMGEGLNRTSLAGFIIAMGMLVDNAIVVTDNANQLLRSGGALKKSLISAATSPSYALLGATFIAIISFLPLYLAPSSASEIVKPLFVVLSISLALSWLLAMSQTPLFGMFLLKTVAGDKIEREPYTSKFYSGFARVLSFLIRFRWATLGGVVVVFLLSLFVMSRAPSGFFPNLEKPYFKVDCTLINGYSIFESERELDKMSEWLEQKPGVENISVSLGSSPLRYYLASTSFGPLSNFGNILIELESPLAAARLEREFAIYAAENFPNVTVRSSLFKLSPAVEAAIEIGFTGENIDTLLSLNTRAQNIMRECSLVGDVRSDWGNLIPVLKPIYSQNKGQLLGISRQQVAEFAKLNTSGLAMGSFGKGDEFQPILLRSFGDDNLANITTLPISSSLGNYVSMNQVLSAVDLDYDFSVVKRFNRQRTIKAQCDPLIGANTKAAFAEVYAKVYEAMSDDLPLGYTMKVFGEQESESESNEALAKNMPLTILLIFIVLMLLFRDYRKALVVVLMLPLIFVGVVLGLALTGKMMDFFAVLGLIGLVGMNIKNAVVLIEQINVEMLKKSSPLTAVVDAAKSRIVPVVMASGTTILGMLPLLFDALFGGMAATIMGGLLVASLLTLFILPVTFCLIMRIK
ncbi:MAG: efflux RND transporter permease subunit [Rikenellaceae bacterium]